MKDKIKKAMIISGALIGLFIIWQLYKLTKYTYRIKKLKIDKVGLKNLSGVLYVDINNPSSLSATIEGGQVDIFINNVKISESKLNEFITISAASWSTVPIPFFANPSNILSIRNFFALQGILDPDQTELAFRGFIYVKKFGIRIKVPINLVDTFAGWTAD